MRAAGLHRCRLAGSARLSDRTGFVTLGTRNASHAAVSALTCIPYLSPPCFALVQLKNLSVGLGAKFAHFPQVLPFIFVFVVNYVVLIVLSVFPTQYLIYLELIGDSNTI